MTDDAAHAGLEGPVNLDYEDEAEAGAYPPGWRGGGDGYEISVVDDVVRSGRRGARIRSTTGGQFAALTQSIDAAAFAGRGARLTGHIRPEGVRGWAGLWLRADRADGTAVAFDNMRQRPVRGDGSWQRCEILLAIPEDASTIVFGALLSGAGTIWVDDLALDSVASRSEPAEPPRALSETGLLNLFAFARTFGLVRFFHAGMPDSTDWDELAIAGVGECEATSDLAGSLRALFPGLGVGAPPALPEGGAVHVAWRHVGCGLGGGSLASYSSERVPLPPRAEALLHQQVALPRGGHVVLKARARSHSPGAALWTGVRTDDQLDIRTTVVTSPEWSDVLVERDRTAGVLDVGFTLQPGARASIAHRAPGQPTIRAGRRRRGARRVASHRLPMRVVGRGARRRPGDLPGGDDCGARSAEQA